MNHLNHNMVESLRLNLQPPNKEREKIQSRV